MAAPRMTKYRPAGEVHCAEATESNLDDLAEMAGAQVFTSPRGGRYALVESASGTTRLDVGGFLVQHGEGKDATYEALDAEAFAATYAR